MLKTPTGHTCLPPVFGKPSYEELLNYVIESLNIADITAETGNKLFYCYCLLFTGSLFTVNTEHKIYVLHCTYMYNI
jgi:hypothetical protein